MKKKDIILISIIIILLIPLIGTIIYYNQNKDSNDIANNKDITNTIIDNPNLNNSSNNTNNQDTSLSNNNQTSNEEKYTEADVISYFENLNNELTTYDNSNETLGKTLKSNFVKCIDFIFYNEQINGITFSELTNNTKLKILSLALSIDTKIENNFPGYKDSINNTYQNLKSKIIEKYLETTTNICTNDQELCIKAKEQFQDLKSNFSITWDLIKDLASNGVSKIKDWYEIWRYN